MHYLIHIYMNIGILATLTLANEISGSTVYSLKVDVPMKCSNVFPLHENLLLPSGITPLPCVALYDDVIRDHVSTNKSPDLTTQVSFRGFAKLALSTLRDVQRYHMIP